MGGGGVLRIPARTTVGSRTVDVAPSALVEYQMAHYSTTSLLASLAQRRFSFPLHLAIVQCKFSSCGMLAKHCCQSNAVSERFLRLQVTVPCQKCKLDLQTF